MKKYLLYALALLMLLPMSITAQQVTLNVLYYADATQAGYSEDVAIRQKFQDDNPDINMVYEELFNEPYHDKLSAYIAAGQMPDILYLWPSMRSSSALVHQKKLVKDLTPLLGKEFLSAFVAPALNPKAQASNMLAELPQAITYTTVMYTNKKLLSDLKIALPKTYADLKAMVPKLRAKGIQTILIPDSDKWPLQSCLFSTIVGRMLGDSWMDSTIAGKTKFTDVGFVNALKFVQTMFTDGVINWSNMQQPYGDGPGLFASGKAAFFIDGDWRQGAFLTDKESGKALIAPENQASDFALLNFPAIPGEKNPGIVSAIVGVGYAISADIPKGSDKEKAAVDFIKYLYSPEVQKIRLETGAYIPTRKDVTSEALEPFTQMMPKYYASIAKTCYVIDGVLDPGVNDWVNNGLQEIGLGAKTPAQVAADLQKAMDAWLKTKK